MSSRIITKELLVFQIPFYSHFSNKKIQWHCGYAMCTTTFNHFIYFIVCLRPTAVHDNIVDRIESEEWRKKIQFFISVFCFQINLNKLKMKSKLYYLIAVATVYQVTLNTQHSGVEHKLIARWAVGYRRRKLTNWICTSILAHTDRRLWC